MLFGELRYSLRVLAKSPAATLLCLATFAFGLGANIAIFSILNATLLKPLPFPEFRNLISMRQMDVHEGRVAYTSMPDFLAYENGSRGGFQSLAGYSLSSFNLNARGIYSQASGAVVTRKFFAALGIGASRGRTFSEQDPEGSVVVSHALWVTGLAGDPAAIEKPVLLDGRLVTVVGVMPASFRFPEPQCEIWQLITEQSDAVRANQDLHFLRVFGRLREAAVLASASAELKVANAQLVQAHPDLNANLDIALVPLSEELTKNIRPSLLVLMVSVAFVLLIACANVANFQLSRVLDREREIAVRLALGAPRLPILRQLFLENLLLSMSGGVVGFALAALALKLSSRVSPIAALRQFPPEVDTIVVVFVLVLCIVTAALVTLVPAVQFLYADFSLSLKEQSERTTAGTRSRFFQHALMIVEVAIALVLLIAVGLFTRSFVRLGSSDVGFDTAKLTSVSLRLPKTSYPTALELRSFREKVLLQVSSLPGVISAVASSNSPLVGGFANYFTIRGAPEVPPSRREMAVQGSASAGFFQAMGVPVRSGREFSEFDVDKSQLVAIVNQTMARRYWPEKDPVGAQIRHGVPDESTQWYTVVGVVGDTAPLIGWHPMPTIFTPYSQIPDGYEDEMARPLTILVRAAESTPNHMDGEIQAAIAALDPSVGIKIQGMDQIISNSLAEPKLRSVVLDVFGFVAFWLGALGIFSVVSTAVSRESKNIAVRMCLGASKRDIVRLLLRRSLIVTMIGLALGGIVSYSLAGLLRNVLFEVSATDWTAFVTAAAVLTLSAVIATYLPARRAARIDPVQILRN